MARRREKRTLGQVICIINVISLGNRITEERDLVSLDKVELITHGKTNIEQGNEELIIIERNDNLIPLVTTSISQGES